MSRRTVYVIDDDPEVLRSTALLVQSMGYSVETFPDGGAFLTVLSDLEPGCILTDLRMPGISGYELKAELDSRAIGWPVVLVTSDSGSETELRATESGFFDYFRKPVRAEQLAAAIDKGFEALDKSGR